MTQVVRTENVSQAEMAPNLWLGPAEKEGWARCWACWASHCYNLGIGVPQSQMENDIARQARLPALKACRLIVIALATEMASCMQLIWRPSRSQGHIWLKQQLC